VAEPEESATVGGSAISLWRRAVRKIYRTGLIGFGRMPHVVQRWVVRIASPTYTVGALLVLEHQGSMLVLRQLHREGWTLPGGLLDHGESPAEAVVRETREELGLAIELGSDLPAATLVEPHSQRVDVIYHREVAERPDVRPRGEAFRVGWRTFEELTREDEDAVTRDVLLLLRRAQDR
jgi:8-oxo-dGTP pyrophosphatase MutT (NUDIX family)